MDINETEVQKKRKRSRRYRNERSNITASSCLSARLHPDFDPAENVTQALFADNPAEEINPKTAPFEVLVELLHPTFIYEYFEKILHFLNSRQKDICFPNIAPFKEAFLVRIVKNNSYLKSTALDDKNRHLGVEILKVIEKNKNVYKWVYSYEDGIINKNVLVYKKQFYGEAPNDQKKIVSSKQAPAGSLASSFEDMSLSNQRQEIIARGFKTIFLNTTLKFINDTNQTILEYPEMSLVEGQYIYSLLYNRNHSGALGLGFRSMYSSLHDAMKELEDEFDFKVSFRETHSVDTTMIALEKVRKLVNGRSMKRSVDLNTSTSSFDSIKLPEALRQIPDATVRATLVKALDFFEDNSVVSLDFKDLPDAVAKLVISIPKLCRQQKHPFDSLSVGCRDIIRQIRAALQSDLWKLQINVGKTCRKTSTRTVTYLKEPMFAAKDKPVKSAILRTETTMKHQDIRCNTPTEKFNASKDYKNSESNNKGKKSSKNYIEFQSAGLQSVDRSSPSAAPESISSDAINRMSAKRKKMMDALSTPLESDRAERMMRNMGWDGGALGARGDGIREPLLPALHIKPGAGLGHVKALPEPSGSQFRSPADFRISFLKSVLRFIEGSEEKTTVSYRNALAKRERRFIGPAFRAINDRKQLGLSGGEETELVAKISKKMLSDITLNIDFRLSNDCKELRMAKEICPHQCYTMSTKKKKGKMRSSGFNSEVKNYIINVKNELCDTKNDVNGVKKNSSDVNGGETDDNDVITTKMSTITILELAGELQDYCESLKMAKSIAFRVLFLEKLKKFLIDKSDALEIIFDIPIVQKQKSYIEGIVSEINKKKFGKKASEIENDVYKEIRKLAADCYLCLTHGLQKIGLKKKFYQKRFTNSSLDPPKSLDDKNTIIYKNSIAYRPEDIQSNVSSKDDTKDNGRDDDDNDNDSDEDILDIVDSSIANFDSEDTMSIDKTENCDFDSKDLTSFDMSSDSLMLDVLDLSNTADENNDDNLEVNNNQEAKSNSSGLVSSNFQDFFDDLATQDQQDSNSSKKSSTMSSDQTNDTKYLQHIVIVPKCGGIIDVETARSVQNLITSNIVENVFLPRLECNGIQNGGLAYSCHNENTFDWLQNAVSVASDVKIIDTDLKENSYNIKMKMNSFIPETVATIFRRLEIYNPGLRTKSWTLLKEISSENLIEYTLNLDENSYKFICEHHFSLFAGVDKARFSIEWD